MLLIFKRFSEYFTLEIDREKKILNIIGEKTNYKKEQCPWRMLWDRCDYHKKKLKEDNLHCKDCDEVAKLQDNYTSSLPDNDFVKTFENQMKVYGFNLVKWEA